MQWFIPSRTAHGWHRFGLFALANMARDIQIQVIGKPVHIIPRYTFTWLEREQAWNVLSGPNAKQWFAHGFQADKQHWIAGLSLQEIARQIKYWSELPPPSESPPNGSIETWDILLPLQLAFILRGGHRGMAIASEASTLADKYSPELIFDALKFGACVDNVTLDMVQKVQARLRQLPLSRNGAVRVYEIEVFGKELPNLIPDFTRGNLSLVTRFYQRLTGIDAETLRKQVTRAGKKGREALKRNFGT